MAKKSKSRDLDEQVSILKTRLVSRAPFLGYLLINLTVIENEQVPIAGITQDGTLSLNPKTFMPLPEDEQAFVLAHEVLHPALLFWGRLRNRDPQKFNWAHDYAINSLLDDWSRSATVPIRRPADCLFDHKYDEMSAEEIYEKIPNDKVKCKFIGLDCQGDGDDGKPVEDPEQTLKWKGKVSTAKQLQDQVQGWGKAPAALRRIVEGILEPKLEWWEILSRWVGENGPRRDYSYRRPGRRSGGISEYEAQDIFLPSLISHGFADVVTLFDTSGSCWGNKAMTDALGEIKGICEDLELKTRVICIDTEIASDVTISNIEALLPHIKGGGGSDYRPAFAKLQKEGFEGVAICITDGYISVPPMQPEHLRGCLWVLHEGGQPPCKWGEKVYMDKSLKQKAYK